MSQGVEWALHACLNLAWAQPGEAVPVATLAAFYELPPAYLNKHLQALARAGIVSSTSGPRGGFRLARAPERITLLDVVSAIEGSEAAFRCESIVSRGPGGKAGVDYAKSCSVSLAMRRAELAWRKELARQTIADLKAAVERKHPTLPGRTRDWIAGRRA